MVEENKILSLNNNGAVTLCLLSKLHATLNSDKGTGTVASFANYIFN